MESLKFSFLSNSHLFRFRFEFGDLIRQHNRLIEINEILISLFQMGILNEYFKHGQKNFFFVGITWI